MNDFWNYYLPLVSNLVKWRWRAFPESTPTAICIFVLAFHIKVLKSCGFYGVNIYLFCMSEFITL
jgi:hypothetical protein